MFGKEGLDLATPAHGSPDKDPLRPVATSLSPGPEWGSPPKQSHQPCPQPGTFPGGSWEQIWALSNGGRDHLPGLQPPAPQFSWSPSSSSSYPYPAAWGSACGRPRAEGFDLQHRTEASLCPFETVCHQPHSAGGLTKVWRGLCNPALSTQACAGRCPGNVCGRNKNTTKRVDE